MKSDPQPMAEAPANKPSKMAQAKRVAYGIVCVLFLLWLASFLLDRFESPPPPPEAEAAPAERAVLTQAPPPAATEQPGAPQAAAHDASAAEAPAEDQLTTALTNRLRNQDASHAPTAVAPAPAPAEPQQPAAAPAGRTAPAAAPPAAAPEGHGAPVAPGVTGDAFVGALVAVMDYELNERFYGWRPNDILDVTDNVNNMQLGVLEVARRTAEVLVERISRTGTTQSFDKDLEKARNNLMINADQYWLPSAETSYQDAIDALQRYQHKLQSGTAFFYSRTDNLIPLLQAYENLLGSCDDNLIKMKENDGSDVSFFRADDYFFYAQGVAGAMHTVLEAVAADFANTIEPRRGTDVLHHALTALQHAMEIHPLIILDGDPSGFLANHRANLAGAISHSRFYIGLLIQALST